MVIRILAQKNPSIAKEREVLYCMIIDIQRLVRAEDVTGPEKKQRQKRGGLELNNAHILRGLLVLNTCIFKVF